jgi:AraC-like DNA-binding protein
MRFLATTFFLVTLCPGSFPANAQPVDTSCVTLESPKGGAVIRSETCTLSVKACEKVASINFSAQYGLPQKTTDTVAFLAHITHAPFKYFWNMKDVPNQLLRGMSVFIDVVFKDGGRLSLQQKGVFAVHGQTPSVRTSIPFSTNHGAELYTKTMSIGHSPVTVHATACFNDKSIRFFIRAATALFYTNNPAVKLSDCGVDICLDPFLDKKPYPSERSFILSFPLGGQQYATRYEPVFGNGGAFDLVTKRIDNPCSAIIKKEDFKGFGIDVTVPRRLFGAVLPDSFGCAIIVKVPTDEGRTASVSWIDAPQQYDYCPILWPRIVLLPKPLLARTWILGAVSFLAGLLLCVGGGLLFGRFTRRTTAVEKFEQTEEEKNVSNTVFQFIEKNITQKEISLPWVAEKLALPARRIESLVKKYHQKPFRDFLMSLRIEIAKERLRSSHSSETAIAESCGFKNVNEMEKYFSKFCRTTPFKFRKENQVT